MKKQQVVAEKTSDVQAQVMQQQIVAEAAKAQEIEKTAQVRVQEAEGHRRQMELDATVVKAAEADKQRVETQASAERQRLTFEAEGHAAALKAQAQSEADAARVRGAAEADASRLRGIAEADVIRAKGEAEAEAMPVPMLLPTTSTIRQPSSTRSSPTYRRLAVRALAEPLSKVDKISIVSTGSGGADGNGSSLGMSRLTGDMVTMLAQVPAIPETLTGVKMSDLMARVPGLTTVDGTLTQANGSPNGKGTHPAPPANGHERGGNLRPTRHPAASFTAEAAERSRRQRSITPPRQAPERTATAPEPPPLADPTPDRAASANANRDPRRRTLTGTPAIARVSQFFAFQSGNEYSHTNRQENLPTTAEMYATIDKQLAMPTTCVTGGVLIWVLVRIGWICLQGRRGKEFLDAGGTVSGFRESRWKTVQQFKMGDYLLCYVVGISRLIGVLEVKSEAFKDSSVIWADDVFPCRVSVAPIVLLDVENALPIGQLRGRLTIFEHEHPIAWTGHLRGSPAKWKEADGELIVRVLAERKEHPQLVPLPRTSSVSKPVAAQEIGAVTVPDRDEGHESTREPTLHDEVQWTLFKAGQ